MGELECAGVSSSQVGKEGGGQRRGLTGII